jgi:hypothetical protein
LRISSLRALIGTCWRVRLQPGSPIDTVLQGAGYPTPITPALPDDNFTRAKRQLAANGTGRTNARLGWMRTGK